MPYNHQPNEYYFRFRNRKINASELINNILLLTNSEERHELKDLNEQALDIKQNGQTHENLTRLIQSLAKNQKSFSYLNDNFKTKKKKSLEILVPSYWLSILSSFCCSKAAVVVSSLTTATAPVISLFALSVILLTIAFVRLYKIFKERDELKKGDKVLEVINQKNYDNLRPIAKEPSWFARLFTPKSHQKASDNTQKANKDEQEELQISPIYS